MATNLKRLLIDKDMEKDKICSLIINNPEDVFALAYANLDHIKQVVEHLATKGKELDKDCLEFRFLIGSSKADVLEFWQPNLVGLKERLECLKYVYGHGYKTSVLCVPLDPLLVYTYMIVNKWITEKFIVGNAKVRTPKDSEITDETFKKFIHPLRQLEKPSVIKASKNYLASFPKVVWNYK